MSNQTFLDALKPGDKVAVRDRPMNWSEHGYRIYTITAISPKRNKFSCLGPGDSLSVDFDKRGSYRVGSGFHSHYFDMEPVTDEIRASIIRDTNWIKAKKLAEKLGDAIGDFARSNPDPEKIERFLESCSELKNLFGID